MVGVTYIKYGVAGEVVDGSGGAFVVVRSSAFLFVIVQGAIRSGSLRGPRASVLLHSSLIRETRGKKGAAR